MIRRRILGFLMLAVLAFAGFAVIACSGDKTLNEGDETGVYFRQSEYGTEKLALDSGNKFTLVAFGTSKSGTYSLKGETLTLKFYYSADGKIDAVYSGNNITFTYNDTNFSLAREIFFTVDFNSLGGSSVPSKIVRNNQLLDVPNSPTRTGYTFIGWYEEEALTNPFHFHTTPITAEKTLFARWNKDSAAVTEFAVDFDLNYEGAPKVASISTIGGKVFKTQLPAPSRTGFNFKGWFVSMSNSASELSYKHTESLVFTQRTTLFAVWESSSASTVLKAPVVSVSNGVISWDTVDNANNYTVAILEKETKAEVAPTTTEGANSRNLPTNMPTGEYIISVRANAAATANNSPTTERFIRVNSLDRVSNFVVVDAFTLTFNPVKNATNYSIDITCGSHTHTTSINNFNSTVYNFAGCGMHEDGIQFTVTASAPSFLSSVSSVFTVLNNLDPIGEIVINEGAQNASWGAVKNATNYLVIINSGEGETIFNNGLNTSVDLKKYTNGDDGISINVTAHARGYNSSPKAVGSFTKNTLPAPQNLRLNDTTISFDEVANAKGYKVRIGSKTFETETNQYVIDAYALQLDLDTNYDVAVTALGESESHHSLESDPLTIRNSVALSPDIKYIDGVFSWIPLIGAETYTVYVNDTAFINQTESFFVPTFNRAGENILKIAVTGDTNYQSMTVNTYSIKFESGISGVNIPTVYKALGDTVVMPAPFKENSSLEGWFTTPGNSGELFAATAAERLLGETKMIYPHNITLYASYKGLPYNITVNSGVSKFSDDSTEKIIDITFGEDFVIPFIPKISTEQGTAMFIGYYLERTREVTVNGKTETITDTYRVADERGISLGKSFILDDEIITARYSNKVLRYDLDKATGSYYIVSRYAELKLDEDTGNPIPRKNSDGSIMTGYDGKVIYEKDYGDLDLFTYLEIPKSHPNGKQVKVLEVISVDSYNPTKNLVSIFIPETIETVSREAFTGCSSLVDIIVSDISTLYKSSNGALIETDPNDESVQTLIAYPFGRSGAYNVPYGVKVIASFAFSFTKSLTSITLPSTVTSIDNSAFQSCTGLRNIIFAPNGALTNIGNSAFVDCSALASISIPNTVQNVGERSFYNTAITSLIFRGMEEGIAPALNLGTEAFAQNKKLKTITFQPGSNVKSIGTSCFFGGNAGGGGAAASALESVTIPNTVTTLGEYAFSTNPRLASVTFQNGCVITAIPYQAFYNTGITSLEIPNSVTTIGDSAFAFCRALTRLTFQPTSQLAKIGNQAFEKCDLIQEVIFPVSLDEIGTLAFTECAALAKVEFQPNSMLTKIGSAAFSRSGVTAIVIPKGVTALDTSYTTDGQGVSKPNANGGVFFSCANLLTVEFEADTAINLIQANTFDECNNLQAITVHPSENTEYLSTNGILYKGDSIFKIPAGKTSFTISQGLTEIPSSVIDALVKLEEFIIEDGNTTFEVHDSILYKKSGNDLILLKYPSFKDGDTFTIPAIAGGKNVVSFDVNAFKQNAKIKHLIISGAFAALPDNAFDSQMKEMHTLTLEEGVTSIGRNTFKSSPKLVTVNISASLGTIGSSAFNQCGSLETVNIADGSKLTKINEYAFNQNSKLKNIILPKGLLTIGQYAFAGCSKLPSLVIPSSVTSISNYVFSACTELKSVSILSTTAIKSSSTNFNTTSGSEITYFLVFTTAQTSQYGYSKFYSSNHPVFYNCTASTDGTYIATFRKNDILDRVSIKNTSGLSATSIPTRAGYTFAGWNTAADGSGTAYKITSANQFNAVPNGTLLYSTWTPIAP